MNATKQDIKAVVFSGCSLECDGVSICNLDHAMKNSVIKRKNKYQVWSDKHRCYNLYQNIDEAVEKFASLTKDKIHG
jgi:hypothetical protein